MQGFCYQENTHFSQAVRCGREKFWEEIRKTSTAWKIDSRRDILDVVERHDAEGIKRWLKNEDYGKFLAKKRGLKKAAIKREQSGARSDSAEREQARPKVKLSARQKFFEKSDEERLLAFAQELKDNLTAFIFSCYEFDATPTANGNPFCHRRLADCHLNGLVMLDIDHVENPLEVFEALKANQELMVRTALAHITSSKKGIRIVFTANMKDGNLADNQIVFAEKLGYKADSSCIDATRNSFAPKEEDILYINEDLLFNYYDEEFDREFTPQYRDKKTQPIFQGDRSKETGDSRNVLPHGNLQTPDSSTPDSSTIKWRGYDVQSIIDARYEDKLPCAADSNRHNESLKLATDLLLMLDGDKAAVLRIVEAQPWVKEIIDERDEKVSQTVASAADCVAQKEKKYASSLPSKAMLEAIQKVTGKSYQEITKAQAQGTVAQTEADINRWLWDWGEQIEALFALEQTRREGSERALIHAATGVGKTYLAAFDSRDYKRVLFVAHREEILNQAAESFRNVRQSEDYAFFNGDQKCTDRSVIFASVSVN